MPEKRSRKVNGKMCFKPFKKKKTKTPQMGKIQICENLKDLLSDIEYILQDGEKCWTMDELTYKKVLKANRNNIILEIRSEFYRLACIGDEINSEWVIWIK